MTPQVSLRRALEDDGLLGKALAGPSWLAWRALLLAIRGEALTPEELIAYRQLTEREEAPSEPVDEAEVIAGRRGGKSRGVSALSCYIAALCDHSAALTSGERGVVLLIAPDQRQARSDLDYCEGILRESPMLQQMIESRTSDVLSLTNGIDIEVRSASFRRLRGLTAVAIVADEAAFWHSDEASTNTDAEILAAARPMLATTRGPMIIISSPHMRRGEVYEMWRRHYGPSGDPRILVARGTSRQLNPSLPEIVVTRALERDPELARAEYLAEWRDDLVAFLDRQTIEACVQQGIRERPPSRAHQYVCFVDPSGGASDSMTMAISHKEGAGESETVIIDLLREIRAPFSPEAAVSEFAGMMKSYRISRCYGDAYGAEWVAEQFRKAGIDYAKSEKNKNELYLDLLPMVTSRSIDLLAHDRSVSQLAGLERRTSGRGRDTIDHRPNAHDDLANAIAGAAYYGRKRASTHVREWWNARPQKRGIADPLAAYR